MGRSRRANLRYLLLALAITGGVVACCLGINILIDPLWYFHGNMLTGVNYAFNERLAKINRFLPRTTEYDCLILGSSTAALLPERQIPGHHCFNMGFSGGVASEFLLYAKYIRARGYTPRLLIVGVDGFGFDGADVPPDVPDFIIAGSSPPSFWATYLSLDALDFSIRTLRGDYPNHRWFGRDFRSHVIARRHPHPPPRLAPAETPPEFHGERAALYVELRHVFPSARAIGFVAPTWAWTIAQRKLDGRLDDYLDAIGRVSEAYDEFLDFSIPSEITVTTTNTYDGLHYIDRVNDAVVAALGSGNAAPGVDWLNTPRAQLRATYNAAVDRFLSSQ